MAVRFLSQQQNETVLEQQARRLIPGHSQLLSKRPDQFAPGLWPGAYRSARGTVVRTIAGKKMIDMSISGIGANVLGYSHPAVNRALRRAVSSGSSSSLNPWEELSVAERLVELHGWPQMVRFARSGGEAMAVAVRIARAATGKDVVLFSGYHGWHDWYLASLIGKPNALDEIHISGLAPAGVPRALEGTAISFAPNDLLSLKSAIAKAEGRVGAIVMEPARLVEPTVEYMFEVRKIANETGAVLIFDEISSGFRFEAGGLHLRYGVNPDIAVFGKALSNGIPMAAIVGVESAMGAVQESFISSTHWSERLGPAAALAVLSQFANADIPAELGAIGDEVDNLWKKAAEGAGINVTVKGFGGIRVLDFGHDNPRLATALTQEMLEHGFLHGTRFFANIAQRKYLGQFGKALFSAFREVRSRQKKGKLPSPEFTKSTGFERYRVPHGS